MRHTLVDSCLDGHSFDVWGVFRWLSTKICITLSITATTYNNTEVTLNCADGKNIYQ